MDRAQAIDAITLVGDALAEGVPEVLGDWALEGHPGTFAFPLEEGGYVTASVEGEGNELLVWFERAGDSTILATPRR